MISYRNTTWCHNPEVLVLKRLMKDVGRGPEEGVETVDA
jgi:hypothetical protein